VRRGLEDVSQDPLLADARAYGASASQLEALRGSIERQRGIAGEYGVWPQHWHAWLVFSGMGTQWRTTRDGGAVVYEGLDYAGLPSVVQEHRRLPRRYRQPYPRLMRQLRTLECAARKELNEG
jgi:Phage related hypothetical protein (DUF1799)